MRIGFLNFFSFSAQHVSSCKFSTIGTFFQEFKFLISAIQVNDAQTRAVQCRIFSGWNSCAKYIEMFYKWELEIFFGNYNILKLNDFIIFNFPCFNTFYKHKPAILFPFFVPNPQGQNRTAQKPDNFLGPMVPWSDTISIPAREIKGHWMAFCAG